MANVSRPLVGLLVATVVFFAVWTLALKPSSSSSSPQGTGPGRGAHQSAITKAKASAASQNASAAAADGHGAPASTSTASTASAAKPAPAKSAPAKPAVTSSTAAKHTSAATATSTSAAHHVSRARATVAPKPRPAATPAERLNVVNRALAHRNVLALLVYNPSGPEDQAVKQELATIPTHGGHVVKLAIPLGEVTHYPVVTNQVQIQTSPTLVIIDPSRQAFSIVGFADSFEIAQRIDDALSVALIRQPAPILGAWTRLASSTISPPRRDSGICRRTRSRARPAAPRAATGSRSRWPSRMTGSPTPASTPRAAGPRWPPAARRSRSCAAARCSRPRASGPREIAAELGGLSPGKLHAAELAADALHRALGAAARARGRRSSRRAGERTLVAMSGGVDSAVAALLRARAGDTVAVTLELWADPENDAERSCCSASAVAQARALAHSDGPPALHARPARGVPGRRRRAVHRRLRGGGDPEPVRGLQRPRSPRRDARRSPTGSAAPGWRPATTRASPSVDERLRTAAAGRPPTPPRTRPTCSPRSRPRSLARMRFPLGELTKPEVRAIAAEAGLPVAEQGRLAGPVLPGRHRPRSLPRAPRRARRAPG